MKESVYITMIMRTHRGHQVKKNQVDLRLQIFWIDGKVDISTFQCMEAVSDQYDHSRWINYQNTIRYGVGDSNSLYLDCTWSTNV